jgi:hypothetical protein
MASRPSACENEDIAAAGSVLLDDASVQNGGPKTGRVTVTGAASTVERATLLDDDPDPQPTLNPPGTHPSPRCRGTHAQKH